MAMVDCDYGCQCDRGRDFNYAFVDFESADLNGNGEINVAQGWQCVELSVERRGLLRSRSFA